MMKRKIAIAMAVALGALGGVVGVAAPASAVSCYGDYCSGQDPQASGCAADAKTVFTAYVYGTGGASWVDIRWSPTCQTNWARSNVISTNIKAVQDTGYTQPYSSGNGSVVWSKMIYSPVKHVKGVIWGNWGTTETPWA